MGVLDKIPHVEKVILMDNIEFQANDKIILWNDFLKSFFNTNK